VSDAQKQTAEAYIKQLNDAHAYPSRIVTEVKAYKSFFCRGSVSPELRRRTSDAAVHRDLRRTKGRESEEAVPGALHREARGAQLAGGGLAQTLPGQSDVSFFSPDVADREAKR